MADPLKDLGTRETPQSESVPGKNMVENNAGGFAFQLDDWARLQRFLILGTEGGTYYVNERKHTFDNAQVVQRLAESDGERLVREIVDVSVAGRAPKVQPAIYALAVAASASNAATRKAALDALPLVCRTGTHLYTFVTYVQKHRGWGRALRTAVARWYTTQDVDKVALQAVKYRQREGWTHRDLLRLSHPVIKGGPASRAELFNWICGRESDTSELSIVEGFQRVNSDGVGAKDAAQIILDHNLPWEAVPDHLLTEPVVWDAILDGGIGITALIRNLARLTTLGVIAPMADRNQWVINKLTDADLLKKGRVHPIQVLDALLTYGQGHGARGKGEWHPVSQIVDALDRAFYLAFGAVVPANKRTLIALDVSGSMGWGPCAGSVVMTPAQGSAAMALVTANSEPTYHITAFSDRLVPVSISPSQRLDDVVRTLGSITMGRTDCAQPMLYAAENDLDVDTFLLFTDNETWVGRIHPFQALEQYRQKTGIAARSIVVGMTATNFSIADPSDPLAMDVVGFDGSAPQVISDFSAGRV